MRHQLKGCHNGVEGGQGVKGGGDGGGALGGAEIGTGIEEKK